MEASDSRSVTHKRERGVAFARLALLGLLAVQDLLPVAEAQEEGHTELAVALGSVVREESRRVLWQVGVPLEGVAEAWTATTGQGGIRSFFTEEGVVVRPSAADSSTHDLGLRTVAWGRAAERRPLGPISPAVRGARVEYARAPEVVEWFVNRDDGLEQGFTLSEPPPGDAGSRVWIDVEVHGHLMARPDADGLGVRFFRPGDEAFVAYDGLLVTDARERRLEARIDVVGERLRIAFDDRDAAYPVTVDPLVHLLQTRLVASDASPGARLGTAVAVDGDTAVITASGADAAYVFVRTGSTWTEQAKLQQGGSSFGASVALEGDLVLVGEPGATGFGGVANAGAAWTFARQGTTWQTLVQFAEAPPVINASFGTSVAIRNGVLAIGAPGSTGPNPSAPTGGAVHVYEYAAGVTTTLGALLAVDRTSGDRFGQSVDVTSYVIEGEDVEAIVVGASRDDDPGPPIYDSGSAYLFLRRGTGGGPFLEWQKLVPGDLSSDDYLGEAVAVDLDTILIGTVWQSNWRGASYVFRRAGWPSGAYWSQEAKLLPSGTAGFEFFGHGLDVEGDLAVVGAPNLVLPPSSTGEAFVFRRQGTTWSEDDVIVPTEGALGDHFGYDVAVARVTVVVGSLEFDHLGGTDAGAGYAYDLLDTVGVPFCSGDGSASICPCGNQSTPGTLEGCQNSTGRGTLLLAENSASVTVDDLVLRATHVPATTPALLFVGDAQINGGQGLPWSDGLRCASGNVVRLGTRISDAQGVVAWGPGLGTAGGWDAGDTRFFQVWYRDGPASPCGTAQNFSNGLEVTFVP